MRRRSVTLTSWALVGLLAVFSAATVVIVVTNPPETIAVGVESEAATSFTVMVVWVTMSVAFSLVGVVIVSKVPDNVLGWMLAVGGTVLAANAFSFTYAYRALVGDPGSLPAGRLAGWLTDISNLPMLGLLTIFLFLLFPEGRLRTRAERRTALVALLGIGLGTLAAVVEPTLEGYDFATPLELKTPEPVHLGLLGIGWGLFLVALVASIVVLVGRLRRAVGRERDQLRLFVWAVVVGMALFGPGIALPASWIEGYTSIVFGLGGIGLLLVPLSVGVAILRHRLLDIDLVIRRTVVVALLGAFITAVYVGVVVGVGALVGDRASPVLSAAAAALVALAFQPVRRRAQQVANRLVYGDRATPYEVLSVLANRMSGTFAADDLLPRIARVLAEGTGAEQTHVWLRIGDELRVTAVWPSGSETGRALRMSGEELPDLPAHHAVPVRHQGELLGALSLDKPAGESISPTEETLVHDVASQSGLALRNVRLTEELRATIEELRASRQRLVRAQDDERRKLERNIHDGAQQQLVALAVKIRMADTMVDKDAGRAHTVLAQLQADAQEALDELRDLARGVYPPLLADEGLRPALEAQARKAPLPVEVHAVGVGRYPQEVETTAYFCCLEALQNVAKYAEASAVEVHVSENDGELAFEVTDDGRGFDPDHTTRGAGLQNMIDRLEAIGGTLAVTSSRGRGTTVAGRVPVDAPAAD